MLIIRQAIKCEVKMYLSIPSIFLVPIRYAKEDILNIKKVAILQQCNSPYNFINNAIKRKEIFIGISIPTQKTETWVRMKEYSEKYAMSKGVKVKIENSEFDLAKQIFQVDELISQGVDVLILSTISSAEIASLVEKAHKAGIKVIAYDRIIENSDLDLFITFNNIRIGELKGMYIIQKVPRGNYIVMSGDLRDYNVKLITEGRMEYIQPLVSRRDIKIVTNTSVMNLDPKIAFNIVEDSLVPNKNEIDAILAPNDDTAGAVIQALEAQGLAGKVAVTGMDGELSAIQRIIRGTQSMTVLKDIRELVKASINAAIKLANGEAIDVDGTVNNGKIDVPAIFVTPIAVDKSNIDSAIIDSNYYTKKQVYEM
jgi:D-xylose transport system substrate-binding protein